MARSGTRRRVRVLTVIARLNVGGPAQHVALVSGRLDPERYETLLVCGQLGRGEGSFEGLATKYGATLLRLDHLRPEISVPHDLLALRELGAIMRDFEPDIVDTHTAKAGFVGRVAARLRSPRPIVVHTYHGHVLEHYFGPAKTHLYRALERGLARTSDRLVGVSRSTVEDLVRLRVADRAKLVHIPLGLDLEPFLSAPRDAADAVRHELDVDPGEMLVTCVGRFAPIKRLDLALRAVATARRAGHPVVLALAGDGEEREALEALSSELGIRDSVRFLGFRDDVPRLASAADVALLTSDNEGTPVALIEAAAAGTPAVATRVGGVDEVVAEDSGIVVPPRSPDALAAALARMAELGADGRAQLGETARRNVSERFASTRLLADLDALYSQLLAERAAKVGPAARGEPVGASRDGDRGGVVLVLDALSARFGGTAYLAVQLVEALLARDDVAKLVVIVEHGSLLQRSLGSVPRLDLVDVHLPERGRIAARVAWEALRLPARVEAERADALLTFSGMVPRHPSCRIISLVSNPVAYERPWTAANVLRRRAIARTARRATSLIVPSQAMARLMGTPQATVVPHGVDRELFRPAEQPGDEVLAVGDFYRHKRYDLIIDAWGRLPDPRPVLRLVGSPGVDPTNFDRITQRAFDSRVVIGGSVPLPELKVAYKRARVMVVASEHESFSMPLTEAMASGVPVVARDLPALREVGGPGAIYVSGDDPGDWAAAIERLLSDDALHGELRAEGMRHVESFSWPSVAAAVVAGARS